MNIKSAIVAGAVKFLVDNDIIAKPDPTDLWFNTLFGVETQEQQVARQLDAAADKAIAVAKRVALNRKFNKIVENV